MEAAEERAVVDAHCGFKVAPAKCRLEFPEIAAEPVRTQSEVVAAAEHRFLAQGRAEDVERLAKQVAGIAGGALGPEIGDELVAAERSGMLNGQKSQERDALAQRGATDYRAVRALE
jgi:hypothetical protein